MKISINPKSPINLEQISSGDILNMDGIKELVIHKGVSLPDKKVYIRTLRKSLCEGLLDTIEEVLYYEWDVPCQKYIVGRYDSKLHYCEYKKSREKLINADIH